MKSVVTVILSLVYLVAIFQSCYGLLCYRCHSKDNSIPKCGVKYVSYLNSALCKDDDVCIKIINKESVYVQEHVSKIVFPSVGRNCVSQDLIVTELSYIRYLQSLGNKIDFKICNTDNCND